MVLSLFQESILGDPFFQSFYVYFTKLIGEIH